MTNEEMFELLKEKHEQTNWDDLQSIKEYAEYSRKLSMEVE